MPIIAGSSVFSKHSHSAGPVLKRGGGLTGIGFVSIEELDEAIDTITGDPEWLADFQAMRHRREDSYDGF